MAHFIKLRKTCCDPITFSGNQFCYTLAVQSLWRDDGQTGPRRYLETQVS